MDEVKEDGRQLSRSEPAVPVVETLNKKPGIRTLERAVWMISILSGESTARVQEIWQIYPVDSRMLNSALTTGISA